MGMVSRLVLILTVLVALLMIGVGWAIAGWRGLLSGFFCSTLIGSGLLVTLGTGMAEGWRLQIRRVTGILTALVAGWGAYYGGWAWGWAWSLAGYVATVLRATIVVAILSR